MKENKGIVTGDFGELTLEVAWRNMASDIVVINKIPHIFPGDIVHLPYPTVTIEAPAKAEK